MLIKGKDREVNIGKCRSTSTIVCLRSSDMIQDLGSRCVPASPGTGSCL